MNRFSHLTILASLVLLMIGCAPSAPIVTPTATPTATPVFSIPEGKVIFTRLDEKKFVGTAYGQGETAIILANMGYGGQSQWDPFVNAVDKQQFTVITFSYLHADDYVSAVQDTEAVLAKLKEIGYKRFICMGASLGVTACSGIAHAPEMIGIVMISGPNNGLSLDTSYPKLFIASEKDEWAVDTKSDYYQADEPKTLVIFPRAGSHGTDIFTSPSGDQFLNDLLDFVNNIP